jgi:hypothetical protein
MGRKGKCPEDADPPTVLIDSTHRRWLVAVAVLAASSYGLFRYLDGRTPGGLTGGSFAGLWYGVAGAALMVYAGMLSAHRRFRGGAGWAGGRAGCAAISGWAC